MSFKNEIKGKGFKIKKTELRCVSFEAKSSEGL
jgi:hypothetical protein